MSCVCEFFLNAYMWVKAMFVGKIFELLLTYLLLLATNDSINILIIQYILNIL